ncbi:hypothetical protein IAT38_003568 [Cryptococcus sp. DSM 104549]
MSLPTLIIPGLPSPLAYRLSTPSHRHRAVKPDPACPTIAFCSPPWVDSFLFYPQFDYPPLYQNYNLLALDLPGHGESHLSQHLSYSWSDSANTLHGALAALGIPKVHLVSSGYGGNTSMSFALRYPEQTESLSLVVVSVAREPNIMAVAFGEWLECLNDAIRAKDGDAVAFLNEQTFDFATGQRADYPLKVTRDGYSHLLKSRLFSGELDYSLPVYLRLMATRGDFPKIEECSKVQCPVLFLENANPEREYSEGTGPIVDAINKAHREQGKPESAHRFLLDGEPEIRWISLTDPDPVNYVLTEFLTTKQPPKSLPPLLTSPIDPRGARMPLFPRDISGFELQPEDNPVSLKRRTVGDMAADMRDLKGNIVWNLRLQITVESVTYQSYESI